MPEIFEMPPELCGQYVIDTKFYLRSFNLTAQQWSTRTKSVYGPLSQIWFAELSLQVRERRDWLKLSAFLSRAGGQRGLIRMFDPKRPHCEVNIAASYKPQRTSWTDGTRWTDGTYWDETPVPPYASVASPERRGANSFMIEGLPPSMPRTLSAGDLVEVKPDGAPAEHGHLYEVLNDAPSDDTGRARLTIAPMLRAGIRDGDQVVLRRPMSLFRLVDDEPDSLTHMGGGVTSIGISLMEVLP